MRPLSSALRVESDRKLFRSQALRDNGAGPGVVQQGKVGTQSLRLGPDVPRTLRLDPCLALCLFHPVVGLCPSWLRDPTLAAT